jgi:hypothetical protein
MPPAPPMQRKAVGLAVVAILTVLPARRLTLLGLLLTAGDEGRQPVDVLFVGRLELLRPRLKLLRLGLRLRLLLLARIERLRLAGRKWLAADHRLVAITIVVRIVGEIAAAHIARLLLIVGLGLPELLLRRRDQAEIMLGVLVIIFGSDGIAGTLCITGKLEVFLGNVRGRPSNFHIRSIGLIHPRQWILMMTTTFAVATPHALVLSVSHGLLFCQPLSVAAAQMPPVSFAKNFRCCVSLLPAACPDRPDSVR